MLRILVLILGIACSSAAFSQSESIVSVGAGINGYGISGAIKYHKATEKVLGFGDWMLEVGNIQNKREIALINNALQSSGVYKFNKINYAWALRPYYMGKYPLSFRQDRKSVSLNAIGGVGLPLAYTWPVYILLFQPDNTSAEVYKTVQYDPAQHDQAFIGGRAPFTRGFGNGKITPGLGLNAGLEFAWGNYKNDVKIVTLGTRIEAYSKKLPIMYEGDVKGLNRSLYSMFYLTFAFGFGKQ